MRHISRLPSDSTAFLTWSSSPTDTPPQVTMTHIFQAVVPYIAMSLLLLAIIIAFPAIATWLPNLLG